MSKYFNVIIFSGIIVLALTLFLAGLGGHALIDYDEATYAQVIAECLENKDCLSFTYLGNNWFEKPPLYFWLAAAGVKIFGANEFAQRLPSSLLGALAVLLTGLIAWELTRNRWAALAAAAILLLGGEFMFAARQFRMDVPVTASLLFAIYSFVRGWRDSRWYLGIGLGIGLGVMIKSVVGFLALPLILIFAAAYRRWDFLKDKYFYLSGSLALAIIAPWHIYESLKFGQKFWASYLGLHIFERFRRPIVGQGITVFHYIKYLFYLAEPWTIVFLASLAWLVYKFKVKIKEYDPSVLAPLGAVSFIFIIFSLARTKLFYYLEPMQPFMAIFIAAAGLLVYQSLKSQDGKKKLLIFFCVLLLTGLGGTYWQVFEAREGFSDEFPVADEEKRIGQYLAGRRLEQKIYAYGWNYFETLRYYSGGRLIISTSELDYEAAPFYLIMPTELASYYRLDKNFRQRAERIFEEKNISLYEIR